LIPHNFGLKKANIIDHFVKVKEKFRLMKILMDVEQVESALVNSFYDF